VSASLADREHTALSKGQSLAAQVRRVKHGLYTVPSQSEPGTYWTVVERVDGALQCTCTAGLVGRPCAHKSAVVVRRQREAKAAAPNDTHQGGGATADTSTTNTTKDQNQ